MWMAKMLENSRTVLVVMAGILPSILSLLTQRQITAAIAG